jgi:hypothetical protein
MMPTSLSVLPNVLSRLDREAIFTLERDATFSPELFDNSEDSQKSFAGDGLSTSRAV